MKKFLFLFLAFCHLAGRSQKPPTQAEVNRMMKEMEQNPDVKKAMQQAGVKSLEDVDMDNQWTKLPPRKTKLLAALPKTVLTSEALRDYLKGITNQVSNALTVQDKQNIKVVTSAAKNNSLYLSRAAIGAWYSKQPMQALALASMAASANPNNGEILNTVSAILNLCGFPHRSIPILQTLLSKVPGNS